MKNLELVPMKFCTHKHNTFLQSFVIGGECSFSQILSIAQIYRIPLYTSFRYTNIQWYISMFHRFSPFTENTETLAF